MKITYLQLDSQFYAVTDESPKGFERVLYIGRGPKAGSTVIEEQVFAVPQLKAMRQVAKRDVPAEWIKKLGYEKPERPQPQVEPVRKSRRRPIEEPIFDTEGNLLDLMPVDVKAPVRGVHTAEETRNLIVVIILAFAVFLWCIA